MQTLYVKPNKPKGAKGPLLVRRPERGFDHLPVHGAEVPKNAYWLRRLRDQDVVPTTAEAITKAEKAAKKPAAENSK